MDSSSTLSPIAVSSGSQTHGGAAAFTGSNVHYFYCDGSGAVVLASQDIERYLATGSGADLKSWQLQRLSKMFASGGGVAFSSNDDTAITLVDGWMYLFWIDTKNATVTAARCSLDGGVTTYAQVAIATGGVTTPITAALGITVSRTPNGAGIVLWVTSSEGDALVLRAYTLLPDDLSATQHLWTTSNSTVLPLPAGLDTSYANLSATWVNQGAFAGAGASEPAFALVLALFSRARQDARSYFYPIDASGALVAGASMVEINGLSNDNHKRSLGRGVSLSTDPGGRVVAFSTQNYTDSDGNTDDSKSKITFRTLDTFQTITSASAWGAPTLLQVGDNVIPSHARPVIAYVAGPAVSTPDVSIGRDEPAKTCFVQSIMGFVFGVAVNDNQNPRVVPYYWGQLTEVPNYRTGTPLQRNLLAVTLVADAFPVPVPRTNVWGNESPDGMGDWQVAAYRYLTSKSSTNELTIENSGVIGVRSAISTTAGIGPQMETSVRRGTVKGFSSMTTQTSTAAVTIASKAHLTPGDANSYSMNESGVFNAWTYPGVSENAFVFSDASGATVSGVSAPLVATLVPTPSSGDRNATSSGAFQTYVAQPGQLTTYQPSVINERMQRLFAALTPAQQALFTIDGEDFAPYYTIDANGRGYVEKITERFATPLNVDGATFLEFAFSENGATSTEFQSTESFRSNGGLFYDASFYSGVGGGAEFEIFGIGFAMSAYRMSGVEFQSSIVSATGTDSAWGIDLSTYLNVLDAGQSYTARLYLLQPSKLWSVELRSFSTLAGVENPAQVDLANSAPVRILFTVPLCVGA